MKLFSSLSSRLLVSAALLISLFMALTGWSLNEAFKDSLLTAEQERLRTQVYLLLGVAELDASGLSMPVFISEPRFNQVQSGLYAVINSTQGLAWQSLSSQSLKDEFIESLPSAQVTGQEQFALLDDFFVYSYQVIWEEGELEQVFQISVLHAQSAMWAELRQYQDTLWRWLGIATLALLFLLLLVLRWGLLPLRTLAEDLKNIEQGSQGKLSGDYPKELQGITANLNELLQHEAEQRQRYRDTLGDLAHSLKTPLAVIQGELEQRDNPVIAVQTLRMQDIVAHQLSRAVRQQVNATAIPVGPCIQRIVAALQKVYANKAIQVEQNLGADELVKVGERDLMEVLGNVLDNAFKHAQQHIRISLCKQQQSLTVIIEDDGEGIAPEHAKLILQRGQRLDTQQAGQGIGLAVVVDIMHSYSGEIALQKSDAGGLLVQLSWPH